MAEGSRFTGIAIIQLGRCWIKLYVIAFAGFQIEFLGLLAITGIDEANAKLACIVDYLL
ncbi:hypothetical protein O59_004007 [Cellvibrio sp. BR]|nr:hypothetical protein O59_004007 [Cellvibrio sp. BR]